MTNAVETESPVYALRVANEKRACRQLEEIGLASWAPTYQQLLPRVRNRPPRSVDIPLFRGYVFARLAEGDFAAAMAASDVFGVVSIDGQPIAIPEAEWVRVILMVMSGRFDETAPATKARPRGERRRSLAAMQAWFVAAERSQLKSQAKRSTAAVGGESVSEGSDPSRRSTGRRAVAA